MGDVVRGLSVQALMREVGLTPADIERRLKSAGIEPEDTQRIASIKELIVANASEHVEAFFDHLKRVDGMSSLFRDHELLERSRELERTHLQAMVQGDYGHEYVSQRIELGMLYTAANVETNVLLGAIHALFRHVGEAVIRHFDRRPLEGYQSFMALKKIVFFDIGIIADVLVTQGERVIRKQQEAIRELSTPVLQIRERMLLLPIIGVIDTHRARLLTDSVLRAIRDVRAKVVVMDVTGVATVDSKVANHLLQTIAAARLMGATMIVTGLSSEVAQSLVALGIEIGRMNTAGDLQGGMEEAERLLGYRLIKDAGEARR